MNFAEYQDAVHRTILYPAKVVYPALKLNGEAGEVAEVVGKIMRGDYAPGEQPVDPNNVQAFIAADHAAHRSAREERAHDLSISLRERLTKELGDVLWYIAAMAEDLGLTLEEVAETNAAKVLGRKARGVTKGSGSDR